MSKERTTPLLEGRWGDHTTWEFHLAGKVPDLSLCTAVGCVAIMNVDAGEVVLEKNTKRKRYETPAGHTEMGETIEETLERETLEETGFIVGERRLFGYRKVLNSPEAKPARQAYPPVAYIPYFYAFTDQPLQKPTGDDIDGAGIFSVSDIEKLVAKRAMNEVDFAIIREGLAAARARRKR